MSESRTPERLSLRILTRADATANAIYGWRWNPLYQSGSLAVLLLVVVMATGTYLLLFYRIGSPYLSVAGITDQAWFGRWIRGLHRYASDAIVVAAALHGFRMFAQRRSWGARTLAWLSGLLLVGLVLVCGWTGYVMVWDVQAQALAVEGARLLDVLPLFADPVSRAFEGTEAMPSAFFFLNLFLHIVIPVGMALALWVHVSRVARAVLIPPRALSAGAIAALLALSIAVPVGVAPPADLLRIPGEVPLDLFFGFWLPFTRTLPPAAALGLLVAAGILAAIVPLLTRPRAERRPPPSVVDERLCTGCVQCSLDCPYEAITMIERRDGRVELVAHVNPARCVSCGICAGSCAPMGVGPAGRTGRDQLGPLRARLRSSPPGELAIVACDRSAVGRTELFEDCLVVTVTCAGNAHTSVVEQLLRDGARGVLVLTCPPRDCWNREGPRWIEERLFHDREAELHRRVDRRRVGLAFAAAGAPGDAREAVRSMRARLAELDRVDALEGLELERACDPAEPEDVVRA